MVAVGCTVIFGVLNLLYFAHGEVCMAGAFVGLVLLVLYAGVGIYGALLGANLAGALQGVVCVFVAVSRVNALAPLINQQSKRSRCRS